MVKSSKFMFTLAAIFIFLFVFAGCGGNGQGAAGAQQPQVQAEAGEEGEGGTGGQGQNTVDSANSAAAGGEVRTVEHAMGTTEIPGTPQKVVTLFQGATDAALLLGVKPAGAVESWIEQPWYNYIRDRMDGAINLGSENQPNLEEIIALHPDVIIASKTRHEKIYEQLSNIAPTVMTEEVHIWKDTLHLTAEALNKQAEEQQFLTDWEQRVADFKTKMGDKLKLEAGIVDFRVDHARIVYTGFSALVLEELGIARPAGQQGEDWGVQLTSKENIPQMDADIIFDQTSTTRDDGRLDLRKEWTEHPLWQNLKAVQNNRVFEVDTAVWNNGSGPLAAQEMLEDLYEFYGLE
ncbi:iron-siderophore ABC transporter substrate-binding protein [Paenibacillus oralis]|uniref:Iron-siderophore ABC transporter substrate-binding protein n=1 Tax=Paenibacillus oralis TaxID=2490856 RepID=A0A3P3U732_9BACL|nr:iron-siderophore ABC transporter substrate-binding protein [Paenibacillus oralis]RRJ66181.1 iron-siderophore ABC transporter substrate-binding protein [Paenibacillus oralis]